MSTVDDIVDAEIVDERRAAPAVSAAVVLHERIDLVVRRIAPAVGTVKVNGRRWAWSVVKFLLLALTVDLWRGLCTAHRAWWRWKTLATQTERAGTPGKGTGAIEDRLQDRRERRTVQSLAGALVLVIAIALFWWLAPAEYKQYAGIALVVALFLAGHTWRHGADAPADERPPGYDGSIDSVRDGLRVSGAIPKDGNVWWTEKPHPVGAGVQFGVALQPGKSWEDVLTKKGKVAGSWRADSDFMMVWKRNDDADTGIWIPERDPYEHGPDRYPLLDCDEFDCWDSAPFAVDPRGKILDYNLAGAQHLGGGQTNSGKSWSARPIVAPYMLDPCAKVFCANGKGDQGTWAGLKDLANGYVVGAADEDAWTLNDILDKMEAERVRRAKASTGSKIMDDAEFRPWLLVVDELQEYLASPAETDMMAFKKKNAMLGAVIEEKLTTFARLGRSQGLRVVILTQKPDPTVFKTALRAQFASRFANRTDDEHASKMILGKPSSLINAATINTKYPGLGILVPGGDKNKIPGYPLCRPFMIDDDDFALLGRKGAEARRRAGTLNYLRGSHATAKPLPERLEAILGVVEHMADDERIPSRELRRHLGVEDKDETKFGRELRDWGCPSGQVRSGMPKGPLVGDIRRAVQRIREGGPIKVSA